MAVGGGSQGLQGSREGSQPQQHAAPPPARAGAEPSTRHLQMQQPGTARSNHRQDARRVFRNRARPRWTPPHTLDRCGGHARCSRDQSRRGLDFSYVDADELVQVAAGHVDTPRISDDGLLLTVGLTPRGPEEDSRNRPSEPVGSRARRRPLAGLPRQFLAPCPPRLGGVHRSLRLGDANCSRNSDCLVH